MSSLRAARWWHRIRCHVCTGRVHQAYDRGMDESGLTRRQLLELAGASLGPPPLPPCPAAPAPAETSPPAPAGPTTPPTPAAPTAPATAPLAPAPLTVQTSTGSFVSAFRPGT